MNNTGWHLRDLDTSKVMYSYSFSPNDSVPLYRKTRHFGEPGYPAGMIYFFSGIKMKKMMAIPMIVNTLDEALKAYK
jgi:hypothetical protein